MKKFWLYLCSLLLVSNYAYADISGYQVTQRPAQSSGYNIVFFDNFSLSNLWGTITGHSAEYVANSSGGTQTKGMRISHCTGIKSISLSASVSSGTQTILFRGAIGTPLNTSATNMPWVTFLEVVNTGSTTTSFPINEHYDFIQVKENITSIGTDTLTVRGSFLGATERLDRDFTDGF